VGLPETNDPTRRPLDFYGFVLGAFTVGAATYATITGETYGYITAWILTLYVISFLSLVAFVLVERKVAYPMLNLKFFRLPAFAGSTFVALTSYFSILSIFFFVALYLVVVGSAGAYQLAQDFLPLLGGMVAASLFTGRWVGAVGSRLPMMVGCLVAAAGVFLTNSFITPTAGLTTVGWTMCLAGIGFGILVVPVTSTALTSLPPEYSGMAASITNTSRELGAVAGVAILGSIVNGQLTVQLTKRLVAIGIPQSYRTEVITAVTTGSIGTKVKGLSGYGPAVQKIIHKVVQAAYQAFTHGLNLALSTSFVLLLISAVVAYVTGTSERA
ncbi:MAG TPA: MFS transporter, partial [Acidimicrobiales bacterium]